MLNYHMKFITDLFKDIGGESWSIGRISFGIVLVVWIIIHIFIPSESGACVSATTALTALAAYNYGSKKIGA